MATNVWTGESRRPELPFPGVTRWQRFLNWLCRSEWKKTKSFNDPANWSNGSVPVVGDEIVFPAGMQIDTLNLMGGTVTFADANPIHIPIQIIDRADLSSISEAEIEKMRQGRIAMFHDGKEITP